MTPTIHWSKPICKEPDDYLGWGTIARKDDGELLAVFSGRRESHWCPYGVNEIIRSSDDGETWSDPEIINNTPLDDRDTGLLVMRSGVVIMSWFTGAGWQDLERYRERTDDRTISAWERHYKKIGQRPSTGGTEAGRAAARTEERPGNRRCGASRRRRTAPLN